MLNVITCRRRWSDRGFSLVELVIVIGMIAVILAIATPSIVSWRNNLYFRQSAKRVLSTLREARSAAISRNVQRAVVFKPNSSCFEIFSSSQRYNTQASGWFTSPGKKTVAPASVTIKSGSAGTSSANVYVKFNPNGTAVLTAFDNTTPSDPNVSINDQSVQKYLITVTATGRITLQQK
jgi:prepilin-type N-terminal cleavage/methylation domain-containing protein